MLRIAAALPLLAATLTTIPAPASAATGGETAGGDQSRTSPPGTGLQLTGKQIPDELTAGTYIVTFLEAPAATYRGGVSGFDATAAEEGHALDVGSTAVKRYTRHLERTNRQTLDKLGATATNLHSIVLNGAMVELTAQQALQLSKNPRVQSMEKSQIVTMHTDTAPDSLGLPAVWDDLGGRDKAGSGVVVGVLDSGIWPESASFAPNTTPIPNTFTGECQSGEEFTTKDCNGKIVGARFYLDGYGAENVSDEDFLSTRDGTGHGTHTASTAVGDHVSEVHVGDRAFGDVSGMAPGAKVAAYKVCWQGKEGIASTGCATPDIVQAIEDAVADGVDVINMSLGGGSESPVSFASELAAANAADAGVFVAASAGNSGPGTSTLDHPSPWLTTVAASTHKVNEQALELADGRRFVGASSTDPLPALTGMVMARTAAVEPGEDGELAAGLCAPGSLDAAVVSGKLVVCLRGQIPRVDKSLAVRDAGGAGMVMINPAPDSLNADMHYVPSVHLPDEDAEPVMDYVAGADSPQGKIVPLGPVESDTKVPEVAEFSARGPSTTTGGDILKPDLSAPGVDVLAAVTPFNHEGRNFDLQSGTSMSSPIVAGVAALLRQQHPGWSPMMIKSALMTTARDHASTDDPFAQGAGLIRPELAMDPGLVFDHGIRDWVAYLKGLQLLPPDSFTTIAPIDGSQLNQASVAIGDLTNSRTITRTVTNVSSAPEHYQVHADVPGLRISATPSQFTLAPGQTRTVSLLVQRTSAPLQKWATGSLVFSSAVGPDRFDGDAEPSTGHIVELPVAVQPLALAVDQDEVSGTGSIGSAQVEVSPGFSGTVTSSVAGLVAVTPQQDSVSEGEFDAAAPAAGRGVDEFTATVEEGATVLRVSTQTNDGNDLDVYVYREAEDGLELLGIGGTTSGNEEVTLEQPEPGTYRVFVHGFSVGDDESYTYRQWVVPGTSAGNLEVGPATFQATAGVPAPVQLRWSGLDTSQEWFGAVTFADPDDTGPVTTYVTVTE